eukprot:3572781-Prymnesium_polylepis.1
MCKQHAVDAVEHRLGRRSDLLVLHPLVGVVRKVAVHGEPIGVESGAREQYVLLPVAYCVHSAAQTSFNTHQPKSGGASYTQSNIRRFEPCCAGLLCEPWHSPSLSSLTTRPNEKPLVGWWSLTFRLTEEKATP